MKKIILLIFTLLAVSNLHAQYDSRKTKEIDFDTFLALTLKNNFGYIIEKYEVSMAEAAHKASKVLLNPELEIILPRFHKDEFSDFPRNIAFEMDIPVELFGKRKNRIRHAEAEKFAAKAMLEDYLRYLRADVASVFVQMLSKQLVIERMKLSFEQVNQLVDINQSLFEAGEIGEIDVLKTRLEARSYETEMFDMRAEMAELMAEAYYLIGGIPADSLVFTGNIVVSQPIISINELKEFAFSNRADLIATQHKIDAARFEKQLARSERLPDISLIAGYHNDRTFHAVPGIQYAYAGISVPIPIAGLNRGKYTQQVHKYEQSKTSLDALTFHIENDLMRAYDMYKIKSQKRMIFTDKILKDAEQVRDAVLFSYQRGEASLLELIDAQRTTNEMYMNYYQTLTDYNMALIELSKHAGMWLHNY